ncbi:MAG TPA: DUF4383 domain-containing protein [Longimicrobium sp.]|nr:DUF4383 domain-containing protein [Longimicrobium sp.]
MRSLAQRVALIFGVVFILVALGGFITPGGMGMDANPDTAPRELGLFPINLLHNLVHLAFGIWGIAASRSWSASRTYCRVGGVIYIVLTILAFVDPTTFGLVPIGGNDIWLHAVLGIVLAAVGFTSRPVASTQS